MKRIKIVIMAMLMIIGAFSLVGCDTPEKSDIVGIWKCNYYSAEDGCEMAAYYALDENGSALRIVLKAGTSKVVSTTKGQYKIEGSEIWISETESAPSGIDVTSWQIFDYDVDGTTKTFISSAGTVYTKISNSPTDLNG